MTSTVALNDSLVMASSFVVWLALGWFFFMKQLFRDYECRNRLVQLIFSVTFALSCIMFELIIFEIGDVLQAK